jgi:hypothetical protein
MRYKLVEIESNAFYSDGPLVGVPCHTDLSDWTEDPNVVFNQLYKMKVSPYDRFFPAVMDEDHLFPDDLRGAAELLHLLDNEK